MRIAVAGDTHGEIKTLARVLKEMVKPQMVLFTGDHYRDGRRLAEVLRLPVKAVVGNCDGNQPGKKEEIVLVEGHRILLTHGHLYKVKTSLLPLKLRAREAGVSAVCFGHTHSAGCEQVDGIWFINPGSPTHPRGGPASLAVMEVDATRIAPRILEF